MRKIGILLGAMAFWFVSIAGTASAVSFSVNGSSYAKSAVGRTWTLSLTDAKARTTFSLCMSKEGVNIGCIPAFGETDSTGAWTKSGAFGTNAVGSWREWLRFASGEESTSVWITVYAKIWIKFDISDPDTYSYDDFIKIVGDQWKLTLSEAPPLTAFSVCMEYNNGPGQCIPKFGTTDANGTWSLTGKFDGSTVGRWKEWLQFPSGEVSTPIVFTVYDPTPILVVGSPSPTATFTSRDGTVYLGGLVVDCLATYSSRPTMSWTDDHGRSGDLGVWYYDSPTYLWWLPDGITDIVVPTGNTTFTITAKNFKGVAASKSVTVTYAPDTLAVLITDPTSDAVYPTRDSAVRLSGSAYGNVAKLDLTINGSSANGSLSWARSGDRWYSWSAYASSLPIGANAIKVVASDKAGNTAEVALTVDRILTGTIPGGPGKPELFLTKTPDFGAYPSHLQGVALHVDPDLYEVVGYVGFDVMCINGDATIPCFWWWIKPYEATPRTPIGPDGTWDFNTVTGGIDRVATFVVAYLIPKGAPINDALGVTDISDMDGVAIAKAIAFRLPKK